MSKYIGSEEKVIKAGEKLNFENLSKSPVTVGTAVMFNKDGVYICDVLNGKVMITCGDQTKAKRGEWIRLRGDKWACSECGNVIFTEGSWENPYERGMCFCNKCGADMRSGGKTE